MDLYQKEHLAAKYIMLYKIHNYKNENNQLRNKNAKIIVR